MTSRRTTPLPAGWAKLRRRILRRDAGICHVCGRPGADEVDHVVPASQGGTDDPGNLAAIHDDPCHRAKTAREANAAKPTRKRPTEQHPGLVSAAEGVAGVPRHQGTEYRGG